MIPNADFNDGWQLDFEVEEQPSYTFRLDFENNRIIGTLNGLEAVKQAVYLIIEVERYDWLIYSRNYGIELQELIGKNSNLVIPEVKRVLTEAITQDDRVVDVRDFEFDIKPLDTVHVTFTVETVFGEFEFDTGEVFLDV